jgi:6-phosphogluconolactonase (cycloisomerase 2 family)
MAGATVVTALLLGGLVFGLGASGQAEAAAITPSRSTTIALTYDNRRLVVVNRETNSVSVFRVRDFFGNDVAIRLAEIPVGIEPRCVALTPDNRII